MFYHKAMVAIGKDNNATCPTGSGLSVWADDVNVTSVLFHSSLGQNSDFSTHRVFSVLLVSERQNLWACFFTDNAPSGVPASPTQPRAEEHRSH